MGGWKESKIDKAQAIRKEINAIHESYDNLCFTQKSFINFEVTGQWFLHSCENSKKTHEACLAEQCYCVDDGFPPFRNASSIFFVHLLHQINKHKNIIQIKYSWASKN